MERLLKKLRDWGMGDQPRGLIVPNIYVEELRFRALTPPSVCNFVEAVTPGFYTLVLDCYVTRGERHLWRRLASIRGSCRVWRDWADDQLFERMILHMRSVDFPGLSDSTAVSQWIVRICLPRELTDRAVIDLYVLAAQWNDPALITHLFRKAGLYGHVLKGFMGERCRGMMFHPQGRIAELASLGHLETLAWMVDTLHIKRKTIRKMCKQWYWKPNQAAIDWAAALP